MKKFYFDGENGITYVLFSEICKNNLMPSFLNEIKDWNGNQLKIERSEDYAIIFFMSLGRKNGFGEPDVVIKMDKSYIIFEMKTKPFYKRNDLKDQLEKFYVFADSLPKGEIDKIKGSLLLSGKKKSLRLDEKTEIFKKLLSELREKEFYICCMTDDESFPKQYKELIRKLLSKAKNDDKIKEKFGWIPFDFIQKATAGDLKTSCDKIETEAIFKVKKS